MAGLDLEDIGELLADLCITANQIGTSVSKAACQPTSDESTGFNLDAAVVSG